MKYCNNKSRSYVTPLMEAPDTRTPNMSTSLHVTQENSEAKTLVLSQTEDPVKFSFLKTKVDLFHLLSVQSSQDLFRMMHAIFSPPLIFHFSYHPDCTHIHVVIDSESYSKDYGLGTLLMTLCLVPFLNLFLHLH